MFRGFKNSEYLRYTVSSKIDLELEKSRRGNISNLAQIMSSIFSAVIGATLTGTLSDALTISNEWIKLLIIIGIVIIATPILYFLLYFFIKSISLKVREHRLNKISYYDIQKLIEKFDNSACDSLIVVENYINIIDKEKPRESIKNYTIYEIIHYLKKALSITKAVLGEMDKCVTHNNDSTKISYFRIVNIIEIMGEQTNYLLSLSIADEEVVRAIDGLKNDLKLLEIKIGH